MRNFEVICADKGQHGSLTIAVFEVNDDGSLRERKSRKGKAAWPTGATLELETGEVHSLDARTITVVDTADETFEASARWRFRCPTCGRDVVLTNARWLQFVATLRRAKVNHLDISLIPS